MPKIRYRVTDFSLAPPPWVLYFRSTVHRPARLNGSDRLNGFKRRAQRFSWLLRYFV